MQIPPQSYAYADRPFCQLVVSIALPGSLRNAIVVLSLRGREAGASHMCLRMVERHRKGLRRVSKGTQSAPLLMKAFRRRRSLKLPPARPPRRSAVVAEAKVIQQLIHLNSASTYVSFFKFSGQFCRNESIQQKRVIHNKSYFDAKERSIHWVVIK